MIGIPERGDHVRPFTVERARELYFHAIVTHQAILRGLREKLLALSPRQFKITVRRMSEGELKLARQCGISGWRWWYVERELAERILKKHMPKGR